MRRARAAVVAVALAVAGVAAQPSTPSLSELEQLKVDLTIERIALEQQLAQARAQLADCQGNLGVLEAQARSRMIAEQQRALVAELEAAHPGYTLDLETRELVPKPGPES